MTTVRDRGAWQLFDLSADPTERNDLASQEPSRVQTLVALWDTWNSAQQPPRWR